MSRPRSLPTVAVRGTAERSVAPDSYVMVARVSVQAPQTSDAAAALAERFAALEAAIADLPHLRLEVERGAISMYADVKPLSTRRRTWHALREVNLIGRDTSQVAELA